MGGGRSQQTTTRIPPIFKPAARGAAESVVGLQQSTPVSEFTRGFAPTQAVQVGMQNPAFIRTVDSGGVPVQQGMSNRPFQTAGLTGLERFAQERVGDVASRPFGEQLALRSIGNLERRAGFTPGANVSPIRVDPGQIATSPAIQAAQNVFRQNVAPVISRQARLSGVGSGTAVQNALARANVEALRPLIQSELGREERVLDRGIGVTEANLGRQERGIDRLVGATGATINPLLNIGGAETGRTLQQIGTAERLGGTERGVNQAVADRLTQDFLRRQALSEQGTFVPFGSFAPSAVGTQVAGRSGGVAGLLGK